MDLHQILTAQCREATQLATTVETMLPAIEAAAAAIVAALRDDRKVLTCGNGGSAAEAQHFAEELVGRYKAERRSLPGVSLVADGTLLTCILNDYGADEIFARQVSGLGQPGDVLVALSTSGNSENVVRALHRANEAGLVTLALLGRDGGRSAGVARHEIIIPSPTTARIQEAHLLCIHLWCEAIDNAFA